MQFCCSAFGRIGTKRTYRDPLLFCPLSGGKRAFSDAPCNVMLLKTADEPVEARDHLPSSGPAPSKCVHPSRPRRPKKILGLCKPAANAAKTDPHGRPPHDAGGDAAVA